MSDNHPFKLKGQFDDRAQVKAECEQREHDEHDELYAAAYGTHTKLPSFEKA